MINSNRLIIRPFRISDAAAAHQWLGDPEVMKHIPYGPDRSIIQTETRIEKYIAHFEKFGYSKYMLIDKESAEPVGDAGIMMLDETPFVELGYRIRRELWRKGYATEAARAILKHSFEVLRLPEIHAIVEPDNLASVIMIEEKLNFIFVRTDIHFGLEMRLYRLSKEEYELHNRASTDCP